jgi:hypothetical protein
MWFSCGRSVVPTFKAIELDLVSKRRTGREHALAAATRQQAVEELLAILNATRDSARVDPSRTVVQFESELWTIVGVSSPGLAAESAPQRRAGAKHKRVR